MRKIIISFYNNIRPDSSDKRKLQKGHQWMPPSKIINLWARIKFNSSKWSWEKSLVVFAIISDTSVLKNKSYKKATNKEHPLKLSI